jgi:hypothetical protein
LRRYTFKYSPEPTKRGIVHRPIVHVYLQSKDGTWYLFYPYVDSGADTSLFSKGDASLLKLNLSDGEYSPIVGVSGTMMPAYIHNVKMRIGETLLNADIAFADSNEVPRLLGRTDIFKRFRITFDEASLQTIFETYE